MDPGCRGLRTGNYVKQWDSGSRDSMTSYGSVGMFDVDAAGRLRPTQPASRLGMEFRWRDRPVTTSLRTIGDGSSGVMRLRTQAGRIPSSALAAAARPDAFELLRLLPGLLPQSWTLKIEADHTLQLESEMAVPMPALMSDLLVPAVQFCLAASPYLDLLEENAMGLRA